MAITKSETSITQLTASGTSTTLNCSTSTYQTLTINSNNGSGSISTPATITVQVQTTTATRWYTLTTYTGQTAAGTVDQWVCDIAPPLAAVRLIYVPPSGPSGFTLDAELALLTTS